MVKYLEFIDQNNVRLIITTTSKMYKSPGHAYRVIKKFNTFFTKFNISKVQTLNFRNMKFDKNCSHIGGVNMCPWKSVSIFFNGSVYM